MSTTSLSNRHTDAAGASGRSALPDFLVIGAAKSGTTSLFYNLRDHPEVFCPPVKELNYFSQGEEGLTPGRGPGDQQATTWTESRDAYASYFQGRENETVVGEASVSYLYSPVSAARIHESIPDVKLIAVLRDPVERAWSNYCHMVRDGREPLDFLDALDAEEERIAEGWEFSWHYRRLGLYGEQLERYFDRFSRSQIKIFRFMDLKADTSGIVREIFSLLGVDPSYEPDADRQHNQSGQVRSSLVARFMNRPNLLTSLARKIIPLELGHQIMEALRHMNMKEKPEIPDEAASHLADFYAYDTRRTEQLTGLDLSHWTSHP
jgi:hypothetical protein